MNPWVPGEEVRRWTYPDDPKDGPVQIVVGFSNGKVVGKMFWDYGL